MRFDVETAAAPDQVRRAFTEFGARRTEIWRRTLDPKTYQLREQGDTWAVARESTPGSPFWVVARYDWSDPAIIRWTVLESSYAGGGDGFVQITPGTRGGSRLHVEWTSTDAQGWQRPLLFLLHAGPLGRLIARMYATTLDRYAQEDSR